MGVVTIQRRRCDVCHSDMPSEKRFEWQVTMKNGVIIKALPYAWRDYAFADGDVCEQCFKTAIRKYLIETDSSTEE